MVDFNFGATQGNGAHTLVKRAKIAPRPCVISDTDAHRYAKYDRCRAAPVKDGLPPHAIAFEFARQRVV